MFGFGIKKRAQEGCFALKTHLVSVIRQVNAEGPDSLLKVEELRASKNDDYVMWWVGDFHAMCCDSHKDNVKRVMLDGSGQFNGVTITAYCDSEDPSTWHMDLDDNISGKATKGARIMYETFAKAYGVQDVRGWGWGPGGHPML